MDDCSSPSLFEEADMADTPIKPEETQFAEIDQEDGDGASSSPSNLHSLPVEGAVRLPTMGSLLTNTPVYWAAEGERSAVVCPGRIVAMQVSLLAGRWCAYSHSQVSALRVVRSLV